MMKILKLLYKVVLVVGFVGAVSGQNSISIADVLPKLQTSILRNSASQELILLRFQRQVVSKSKEEFFQGFIDSQSVLVSVRKTSKNGLVIGYCIIFQDTKETWWKKKESLDRLVLLLSKYYERDPLNSVRFLPADCKGNEALCFKDGIAKYQISWCWNDAVQRIKSVNLGVDNQYRSVLEITDNRFESKAD
jgi:hypothetical protein